MRATVSSQSISVNIMHNCAVILALSLCFHSALCFQKFNELSCTDPCKLEVSTEGENFTTSVCKHGHCTSEYVNPQQCYKFKCHCYSSSDLKPYCTPVCSNNAEILLIGGKTKKGTKLSSMELYLSSQDETQVPTTLLYGGREGHTSVLIGGNELWVMGGIVGEKDSSSETTEIINLETKVVAPGPLMGDLRYAAAAAVFNSQIHICGGTSDESRNHATNSCEVYDSEINRWRDIEEKMQFARMEFAMVYVNDSNAHFLLAIGGMNEKYSAMKSAERLEISKKKWQNVSSMIFERRGHGATFLNGFVYVAGGGPSHAERYSVQTDTWQLIGAEMNESRRGLSLVIFNGFLVAISGDTVEVYNEVTEKWKLLEKRLQTDREYTSAIVVQGEWF